MAVNINVTEDENSIDINDVNVFTIHVKDLSVPGLVQITEDVSEIAEDTVDTSTEIRTVELKADEVINISVNEINSNTVTIITTDTNVIEVTDNISIVTAATEAATRKMRGITAVDSIWDQSGFNAHYTDGNVGIGTSDPNHSLDVVGNVNATTFTGTFVGVLSSSAQIKSEISGAFTNLSNIVTTNQSNISSHADDISDNAANISSNTSNINTSISRLSAIETMTGSLSSSIVTNTATLASHLSLISAQTFVSASLQSRVSTVETNIDNAISSKSLISGSAQIAAEISGAFVITSHSIQDRLSTVETNINNAVTTKTLISGSSQIATEISGAFTNVSSSLQSRLSDVEAGSTSKTLISGSAQIASEISGAFIPTSESLQSRVSVVEIASSSFSTRVTELEDTTANKTFNHITASGNISASGNINSSGLTVHVSGSRFLTLGGTGTSGHIYSNISSNASLFLQYGTGKDIQAAGDLIPSGDLTVGLGTPTRRWNKLHATEISASGIRTTADIQIGGNLSVEGGNIFGLSGAGILIDDISVRSGSTQFGSSSLSTHGFTGSMNISGSLTVSGSVSAKTFKGIFEGAISSSTQIETDISGAFVNVSSSIQTRLNTIETELENVLISGSAQIRTEISGAFADVSHSLQTRLSDVEAGSTSKTLISGSAQIATEISGAFTNVSSSIQTRLNTIESELTELDNTLISGSAQIASEISGAFNNIDFSSDPDNNVVVYNSDAKRFYFTSSYGGSSTTTTTSGGTTQYATSSFGTPIDLTKLIINDYSDDVSVTTDNGVLQITFGTPTLPYFTSFQSPTFNTDRFNRQTQDYTLNINYNLNGNTFLKGEVSASTNGGAPVFVTSFGDGENVTINSNSASYHSGSHTFTAKVYTRLADNSTHIMTEILDLQLNKSLPSNPTITYQTPTIDKDAYRTSQREIEEGATGTILFSINDGQANGWTPAPVHFNSVSTTLNILGNNTNDVETGKIEQYWTSGTDNDPVIYRTRSVDDSWERVRSLRYQTSTSPSLPSGAELLQLNNWTGTIKAGFQTKSEIEGVTMVFNPTDPIYGDYIFIVYNAELGNLSSIFNVDSGYEEISVFTGTTTSDEKYKIYQKNDPTGLTFRYRISF